MIVEIFPELPMDIDIYITTQGESYDGRFMRQVDFSSMRVGLLPCRCGVRAGHNELHGFGLTQARSWVVFN